MKNSHVGNEFVITCKLVDKIYLMSEKFAILKK